MFTEQERTITIALPHTENLTAIITITRGGQNDPNESDLIFATARIFLPTNTTYRTSELNDTLQFNQRLQLANQLMGAQWHCFSQHDGAKTRMVERHFDSDRWATAFAAAETWARGEVQKLVDMLEQRHAAFVAAEENTSAKEAA